MITRTTVIALAGLMGVLSLASLATTSFATDEGRQVRLAQDDTREREAFEAAKELGTVEAWDAFLSNFSTGFRADLARAYVKKLGGANPAAVTAPALPSPAAAPCYVTRFNYPGGDFTLESSGNWVERSGNTQFRFKETSRTPADISLYDETRGVAISADLPGRVIWYAEGSVRRKLYDIIGASCGAAEIPQQVIREPVYKKPVVEPRYLTTRPKKTVSSAKKKTCQAAGKKCSSNGRCCSGRCCTNDFEECEGWYGKCL